MAGSMICIISEACHFCMSETGLCKWSSAKETIMCVLMLLNIKKMKCITLQKIQKNIILENECVNVEISTFNFLKIIYTIGMFLESYKGKQESIDIVVGYIW